MGLQTALYVVIGVLTALCLMFMLIGFTVVIMTLAIRPWDGDIRRDYSWAAATPYSGFLLSTWIVRIAYYVNALKPAPLRAMELATAFILSQALFMLVNLGIPDLLLSGPRSADDLAANIGPAVHPDRLARVLDFAAAFNLVNRKKVRCRSHKRRQEPATAASSAASTSAAAAPATVENGEVSSSGSAEAGEKNVSRDVDAPASSDALADLKVGLLEAHGSKTVLAMDNHAADTAVASSSGNDRPQTIYVYSLSAVSACLTSESPVCVADMVKLMEDNYARYQFFSEGMKTGTIPFELWSGGKDFWQHILSSPRHAKTFDHAMVQINQLGGPAVAAQYPFDKFELIVDVAGGVGGFLCDVLKRHKGPKGIVFDQPAQIERAQKLWAQDLPYRPLAARVELVAGDMFDAETIPAPPPQGKVAYILRNILHDWVDADCLRILRSLRRRIADTDKSRVRLLIIEPTSMETPCKNIYPHRLMSDMIMLAAFGDAKERNKQQFETLLDATGWRLRKIKPTTGVFLVLEAVPV